MRVAMLVAGLLLALGTTSTPQPLPAGEPDGWVGIVHPSQVVRVGAGVAGRLEEVLCERGDHVAAGDLLGRLDSRLQVVAQRIAAVRAEARGEVQEGEARVEQARRTRARLESLSARGHATEEELDAARFQEQIALASLEKARENAALARLELDKSEVLLEQRRIISPVDGIVLQRFRSPGELVGSANDPDLAEVAVVDPLFVEVLDLPVQELPRVAVGQPVDVVIDGPVAVRRRGVITVVDGVVDATSETFGIRVELPNPGGDLVAGLSCRVLPVAEE